MTYLLSDDVFARERLHKGGSSMPLLLTSHPYVDRRENGNRSPTLGGGSTRWQYFIHHALDHQLFCATYRQVHYFGDELFKESPEKIFRKYFEKCRRNGKRK